MTPARADSAVTVLPSDVLHTTEDNPNATIVGDLISAEHIPSALFDCAIVTQTLPLIYDVRAAMNALSRILTPSGVLPATIPGISEMGHQDRGDNCPEGNFWCWGFTTVSVRRFFEEIFFQVSVIVSTYGNVLAAVAFLHGLTKEESRREELDRRDPDCELLITVRAVKPDVLQ